jgi:signal transduction histidine kinase
MPMTLETVDAAAVVASAVELVQPLAAERGIVVERDGPSAVVTADRRRLRQVLLNLVSNALRFSPAGTVVTARTEVDDRDVAGTARIHVVDHGPGIPDDLVARLFVPFDRLGADAGREGGAGLGLVLARRLTEAMGGSLELESAVGIGTHVTITLDRPASETT